MGGQGTDPALDLVGRRVLVAGAGVTGRSVTAALLDAGADVRVAIKAAEADKPEVAALATAGATLLADLTAPPADTDLVVTSPGFRPTDALLVAARDAGIDVLGEVELAWRLAPNLPWLAVTGTNGKTTTVGMLESILRAAGADVVACGNIGLPVVDAVRAGHEVLAVELSSFQLHWQSSLRPRASAVLNVAEDHLDWHGTLDEYAAAKGKIYAGDPVAVYNADDPWSTRLAADAAHRVAFTLADPPPGSLGVRDGVLLDRAFPATATDPATDAADDSDGITLAEVADVRPAGPHNVANALAAAALARAYGVPAAAVRAGLRAYEPGAHRAVPIAESGGVLYVDDSKATNPHSAAASLRAHPRSVWIAGGLLKGASVDGLVAEVADRLAGVVLIGTDTDVFAAALARHAPEVPVRVVAARDDTAMMQAVRAACSMAQSMTQSSTTQQGTAVVLAPAAASMDMFTNYAERGNSFAAAVNTVLAETSTPDAPDRRVPGREAR